MDDKSKLIVDAIMKNEEIVKLILNKYAILGTSEECGLSEQELIKCRDIAIRWIVEEKFKD